MRSETETRFTRKHQAIVEAARAVFFRKGYDGTSMEEIAAKASASKQTVYKHFADKQRLFTEIILATTSEIEGVVALVAGTLAETRALKRDLNHLGRQFIALLMDPQLVRLRRLVIANAERVPELGRTWYEQGFERVLATLATCFEGLANRGLIHAEDPLIAAHHFVGLLLWIPVNQAMFTGTDQPYTQAELDRYAVAAVNAFLAAYSVKTKATGKSPR